MFLKFYSIFRFSVVLTAVMVVFISTVKADYSPFQDTTRRPTRGDTLKFPIHDRRGDKFSNPGRTSFDLKDPSNISDSIIYDPQTKEYYIIEKVGNQYYRKPTYLTFDEFLQIRGRQDEIDYFKKRSNILSSLNRKLVRPKMNLYNNLI